MATNSKQHWLICAIVAPLALAACEAEDTNTPADGGTTTATTGKKAGEACEKTDECAVGLYCSGSQKQCLKAPTAQAKGEQCEKQEDCAPHGYFCNDVDGYCHLDPEADGQTCASLRECTGGHVCREDIFANKRCLKAELVDGEACVNNIDCKVGSWCNQELKCESLTGGNSQNPTPECQYSEQCAVGQTCNNGVCTNVTNPPNGNPNNPPQQAGAMQGVAVILRAGEVAEFWGLTAIVNVTTTLEAGYTTPTNLAGIYSVIVKKDGAIVTPSRCRGARLNGLNQWWSGPGAQMWTGQQGCNLDANFVGPYRLIAEGGPLNGRPLVRSTIDGVYRDP